MRKLHYERDFNRSLLLYLRSQGSCLRAVDRNDLTLPLEYDAELIPILRFSHVEQIDLTGDADPPPAVMFGPEPEHGWCYYYQKAELAKQAGDWETVRKLGDEVMAQELKPIDQVEWLPFLEGFLWAGDDQSASRIIAWMGGAFGKLPREICGDIHRDGLRFGETVRAAMQQVLCGE